MVERRRSHSDRSLNKKFNGNEDNGHNDGVRLSATMMACLIVVKLATIGAKKLKGDKAAKIMDKR